MNSVTIVAIVIVVMIGAFVLFGWIEKIEAKRRKQQFDEWEGRRLSDENVLKAKADFEMRLNNNTDLPDGIVWRQAYIYRHLISKWFDSLIAKYRYDDSMATKLRSDLPSYLDLLESA